MTSARQYIVANKYVSKSLCSFRTNTNLQLINTIIVWLKSRFSIYDFKIKSLLFISATSKLCAAPRGNRTHAAYISFQGIATKDTCCPSFRAVSLVVRQNRLYYSPQGMVTRVRLELTIPKLVDRSCNALPTKLPCHLIGCHLDYQSPISTGYPLVGQFNWFWRHTNRTVFSDHFYFLWGFPDPTSHIAWARPSLWCFLWVLTPQPAD